MTVNGSSLNHTHPSSQRWAQLLFTSNHHAVKSPISPLDKAISSDKYLLSNFSPSTLPPPPPSASLSLKLHIEKLCQYQKYVIYGMQIK